MTFFIFKLSFHKRKKNSGKDEIAPADFVGGDGCSARSFNWSRLGHLLLHVRRRGNRGRFGPWWSKLPFHGE